MTAQPQVPESVAAYPRPPALVASTEHVRVEALGQQLADTHRSLRVLETFHPPTYYLPPEALRLERLQPAPGRSFCEWKGVARYFDVVCDPGGPGERRLRRAVWSYPDVIPQPGGFYGGWITSRVQGPFKGDPRHPELV
jgi:uncharacterized protein (DUF427 family)